MGVLLLALGVPGAADAQPLSVRERAYARSVAEQLGKEIGGLRGVETKTKGKAPILSEPYKGAANRIDSLFD